MTYFARFDTVSNPDKVRLGHLLDQLQDYLPSPVDLSLIDLTVGIPVHRFSTFCLVCSFVPELPSNDAYVVAAEYRRVGASVPGNITIHPDFFDLNTASGVALIAHEMYHQWQLQYDQSIFDDYQYEEQRRLSQGLPPWANRFEYPAYVFEAVFYELARRSGLPSGDHQPLLYMPENLAGDSLQEVLDSIPMPWEDIPRIGRDDIAVGTPAAVPPFYALVALATLAAVMVRALARKG